MSYQPKSYRKFLATATAAALVATAVAPAVMAATPTDIEGQTGEAQILRLLEADVLSGNADGSFDPTGEVERRHAAIYFTNALQLEVADDEIAGYLTGFDDVHENSLYAREIAAAVKAGIFTGTPDHGSFNPTTSMSRQHMAVTVVKALGLEAKPEVEVNLVDLDESLYPEFVKILVQNGVIQGSPTEDGKRAFLPNTSTTRGHLAVFLVKAMDEMSVALPGEAVELAVESVSANNLKTLTVEFNKAVDADTVTASAVAGATDTVRVYTAAGLLVNVNTAVSEDGTSLTVEKDSGVFSQGETLRLVVDGVETTDDEEVVLYDEDLTVSDTTAPEVLSAVATTSKTIDIYFSEPVNLANTQKVFNEFELNGTAVFADLVTDGLTNKVTLTLSSSMSVGTHELKVKNAVRDFATFPVAEKALQIAVVEDTAAPVLKEAKLKARDVVVVTFDEPILSSTIALNNANFTVTPAGGTVRQVTGVNTVNNKTYELTLAGDLEAGAIVNTRISYKGVQDLEGNTVTSATSFDFSVPNDITAPSATVDTVKNGELLVTFNEAVDATTVNGAFQLYETVDGKDQSVRTTGQITANPKVGDNTGTQYVLTFTNASALSGEYKLKMLKETITDSSVRLNEAAEAFFAVTFGDVKAPELATSSITGELKNSKADSNNYVDTLKVTVPFNEKMDKATTEDLSNYMLNNGSSDILLSSVTGASATLSTDGTYVTLSVPTDSQTSLTEITVKGQTIASADLTGVAGGLAVKVLGVEDEAGNALLSTQINAVAYVGAYNTAGASISSAQLTGKRTIVLKSNTAFKTIKANDIRFVGDTTTTDVAQEYLVAAMSFSADMKTVTLTLNKDVKADTTVDIDETAGVTREKLTLAAISSNAIVDSLGRNLATQTLAVGGATITVDNAGALITVADKTKPSISSVDVSAVVGEEDTLVVTFDEILNANIDTYTAQIGADLVVTLADGTELDYAAGDFTVGEYTDSDETISIQILKDGVVASEDITVELVNGRFITDAAGNVANTFTKVLTDGDSITELQLPGVASSTIVNGTTVDIVFDEVVDSATAEAAAYLLSTTDAGDTETLTSATLQSDGKTVRLVFSGAVIASGDDVTVPVTVEDLGANVPASAIVVTLP